MHTMKRYTTIAPTSVAAGVKVVLSGEQASARAHLLKPLQVDEKTKAGVYETLSPIQFKVGEEFRTDLELNKALATVLEPTEIAQEKAKAAAAAGREAKNAAALAAKAKSWDDVQDELAELRAMAAHLPENVKADALKKARAAAKKGK